MHTQTLIETFSFELASWVGMGTVKQTAGPLPTLYEIPLQMIALSAQVIDTS